MRPHRAEGADARARRRRRDDAVPAVRRAGSRACCSTSGAIAGFRLVVLHRGRRGVTRGQRERRRANDRQRTPRRHGRRGHRHLHDRNERRAARRRPRAARRRRRRRRHLQLLPARERPRDRYRGLRARAHAGERAGACRGSSIESEYTWPASAVGDDRACSRRSDEVVRGVVATTLELRSGERFLRVAHEIDNQARRPPPARALPAARRGDRLRRRVRVRGRAPRAHGRGRYPRIRASDVSVASVRRRVRRRCRARARARRTARIRSRRRGSRARAHVAARGRLPVAIGTVTAAESRRSERSRRGGASSQAVSAPSTRCSSTAATGVRPIATAPPTSSSCRSNAPGCRQGRPGVDRPWARPCASTAPRCRPCCAPRAASSCACSAPRPPPARSRSSTKACRRAAGSSTCAAGRSRAFEGDVTLDPWQIATLQLT